MKSILLPIIILPILSILFIGCKQENNLVECSIIESPIIDTIVASIDYRDTFTGNYDMRVIKYTWIIDTSYSDTSYYDGSVMNYVSEDSENDLFDLDDSNDDPSQKVTVRFSDDLKITSFLEANGTLSNKLDNYYMHDGYIIQGESIVLNIVDRWATNSGRKYFILGTLN